jgi:hypothetical protein
VAFYGDRVKICEDFAPNFGNKKNWLLNHDNIPSYSSFFTREFFTRNNMTVIPHPPYSPDLAPFNFSVLLIGDKTERPPF